MDPSNADTEFGDLALDIGTRVLLDELQACVRSMDTLERELQVLRRRLDSVERRLRLSSSHTAPAPIPDRRAPATTRPALATSDAVLSKGHRSVAEGLQLEDWVTRYAPATLPVLERTRGEIDQLREHQDALDPQDLASVIEVDPMMTLKLYAQVAQMRGRTSHSDPDSVIGALLMLGVTPFFRAFEHLDSVESMLQDRPDAMEGFQSVLERSFRAARFALAFAVHRMDPDAALLRSAAMLHDVAELLLWCSEPDLALEIRARMRSRPGLRSAQAQRAVLNVRLIDVQHALLYRWRLPTRLIAVLDGHKTENQLQVRTVELAVRMARHTAQGWKDAAIPDDLIEIGRLLQLSPESVRRLIIDIDRD
jgi:HD-like signal output (HDOD) protein